jgi:hypothetical protein
MDYKYDLPSLLKEGADLHLYNSTLFEDTNKVYIVRDGVTGKEQYRGPDLNKAIDTLMCRVKMQKCNVVFTKFASIGSTSIEFYAAEIRYIAPERKYFFILSGDKVLPISAEDVVSTIYNIADDKTEYKLSKEVFNGIYQWITSNSNTFSVIQK